MSATHGLSGPNLAGAQPCDPGLLTCDLAIAAAGYPELASFPAHWLIRQLGDRWSLAIITILQLGPMRFAKLKKSLGTVSHRILALTLRKLERDGLISRFEQPCTPPQVTYALSALGVSLAEQLVTLDAWMHRNARDILAANMRYDSSTELRLKDYSRAPRQD